MQDALSDCVDPKTGQIWVNDLLQVQNHSPLDQGDPLIDLKCYPHIFCVGDVSLTPADEDKAIVPIHLMTSLLSQNMIQTLETRAPRLRRLSGVLPAVYMINFGTQGAGVVVCNDFVLVGTPGVPLLRHVLNVKNVKKLIEWLNLGDLRAHRCQGALIDI
jgi:hypothetical protein